MKKIITLVGTSLITNYIAENEDPPLKNHYERYMHKPASDYELNEDDIIRIKKKLAQFAIENFQASAEIKSLNKLAKELKDDLAVYLIASDTINARICAEVIKSILVNGFSIYFTEKDIISGLQVKDRKSFADRGMESLFKRIEEITGGYYGNMVMNITGGYKAAVPFLTIFSQINHIPTYYIFEDRESLMKIPLLPLSIDWEIFETYADIFFEVKKTGGGVDNWKEISGRIKPEHQESVIACFEVDGNYADISSLGKILWRKYQSRRHIFFRNEDARAGFEKDPNHEKYLLKLFDENILRSKTENKNGHYVVDLGTTAPRIFYRKKDESLYVYQYMRHNDVYERFINSQPFQTLEAYGPFESQKIKK